METIRIAAVGDVHAAPSLARRLAQSFAAAAGEADLILLAGDLTAQGDPAQALVLANACRRLDVPVVAVLGNHDFHAGRCAELVGELNAAGMHVLERSHVILEVGQLEVGVVGTKGFVGGFPGAEIPDFGEPLMREVYRATTDEVAALEEGLEAIAGCQKRIALLHYAPIVDTIVGEPEPIWAFLGSGRLAGPIGAHRPDLVVHGHAHRGSPSGVIGEVPVYNVALHVIGADFAWFQV
jgi:Icc-related predicted phosphoesterase